MELANRVVGATDTLPMLYRYAKKLNNLDTDQILTVLTELVVEVTRADQASVYRLDGEALPLHACNGKVVTGPPLSLEPVLFEAVVRGRSTLSLHDLLERNIKRRDIFLCGPLSEGKDGKVLGVLVVEALEFLRYNPATIRLFRVIIDWACASLETAAQYRDRPEDRRLAQARSTMIRAQRATITSGMVATVASGMVTRMKPSPNSPPARITHRLRTVSHEHVRHCSPDIGSLIPPRSATIAPSRTLRRYRLSIRTIDSSACAATAVTHTISEATSHPTGPSQRIPAQPIAAGMPR